VVDVQTGPEPAPSPIDDPSAAPTSRSRDHWIGLLRVTRVRLVVTPSGTHAFADGTRRHRAAVARIPLSAAVRLSATGVPVTLRHQH
jgi:hypothetical protein